MLDDLGPVDLIGFSTGGMIAQPLAADRPDLIRTVTLVVTGTRLSPSGRAICERWRELAAAGRWRKLHGDMAASAIDGRAAKRLARVMLAATGRAPSAQEAADFAVTVDAVLRHDAAFEPVMPLLFVCGAHDPFFEPDPRAVVQPAGHGLPKTHNAWLQDQIRQRLSNSDTDVAG